LKLEEILEIVAGRYFRGKNVRIGSVMRSLSR
jgi:hypothetical protein